MSRLRYEWKPGARYEADPQQVGNRLEELLLDHQARFGAVPLPPERIVADAASPASPLHSCFEWDDSAAAHEYRLTQARAVARHIVARIIDDEESEPVRAFVHVVHQDPGRPPQRGYTSMVLAMRNPELRAQVLHRALGELIAWQRKYASYEELAAIFEAIDAARADVRRARATEPASR